MTGRRTSASCTLRKSAARFVVLVILVVLATKCCQHSRMADAPRTTYSPEIKAAVMAALLAGQGVAEIAAEYRLPEGTVKSWRSRLKRQDAPVADVAPEKREEVGDLLLRYLRATLLTLEQQTVAFRDPEWLRKQPAGEVAVLHGVLTDKAIRLLEAMGGDGDRTV